MTDLFQKIYWNVKYLIENNIGASSEEELTTSGIKKGRAGCTQTEKALLAHGSWLMWTATSCYVQSHTLETYKPQTVRPNMGLARVWILLASGDLYLWSAILKRKPRALSQRTDWQIYITVKENQNHLKSTGEREPSQNTSHPLYHSAQSSRALDTATSARRYVPVAPASS